MQKVITIKSLKECIKHWRLQGERIAFVPTMGNLHAGHIKLVTEARLKASRVVVSVFVNPIQFGPREDFSAYPRTQNEDAKKLKEAGADLLFLPSVKEIYTSDSSTLVSVSELSKLHCGASRPGHFDGVATVVTKLFNMVQPDLAVFGTKDFQQLLVIQALVKDLNIPVKIIGVETKREADGLAMSSRNGYLSEKGRLIAPQLYQALCSAKKAILDKKLGLRAIELHSIKQLTKNGFIVDYFSICSSKNLQVAVDEDSDLVILTAAKLGAPRLIDNICFSR